MYLRIHQCENYKRLQAASNFTKIKLENIYIFYYTAINNFNEVDYV